VPERQFGEAVMAILRAYAWPGNVRELRNLVESLLLMAEGEQVTEAEVTALVEARPRPASPELCRAASGASLEQAERAVIAAAIARSQANLAEAARALGISRSTLYRKMERYGLSGT
jgi:DNA-binding NtrC family response regulator